MPRGAPAASCCPRVRPAGSRGGRPIGPRRHRRADPARPPTSSRPRTRASSRWRSTSGPAGPTGCATGCMRSTWRPSRCSSAAALVALGEADGCVAGPRTPPPIPCRAALWAIGAGAGSQLISSAFYIVPPGGTVLTFADCAVVPEPIPAQLAHIALAVGARPASGIVGDDPRVAFLSYSTKGSAEGPAVDRVREALALFHERAPAVVADGELQVDAALVPEVAERKAPGSPVAGQANILIFPDLDAGNIGYKLAQRHRRARRPWDRSLQGLARPMSTCRAAPAPTILWRSPQWWPCRRTDPSRGASRWGSAREGRGGVLVDPSGRPADRRQPAGTQASGPGRHSRRASGSSCSISPTPATSIPPDSARSSSIARNVRERGGELRLAGLNEDLRSLFELTKLDTLFVIADTPEQALADF